MPTPTPSTANPSIAGTAMVPSHSVTHLEGGDDEIPLQPFDLRAEITPAQITGNTNDYLPPGSGTSNVWRLSTDALHDLTGIAGGNKDQILVLENVGNFGITLKHDSTSTAANRFYLPDNADQILLANTAAIIRYDTTSSRWRLISYVYDLAAVNAVLASLSTSVTSLISRVTALEALQEIKVIIASFQLPSNKVGGLVNVTGMALAMLANKVYQIRGTILYNSTLAAGMEWQWTGPAGSLAFIDYGAYTAFGGGAISGIGGVALNAPLNAQGFGTTTSIQFSALVICGGTPGNFQLQAAQHTATAEITDFIVTTTDMVVTSLL